MSFSNFAENAVYDKVFRNVNFTATVTHASLHTAAPGETGANEVTGGSYGRQAIAFGAPTNGAGSNTALISFTGMPIVAAPGVVGVAFWDAASAGNCLGTGWLTNAGENAKPFVLTDTTTDLFISPTHGYANNDIVVFSSEVDATTLPAGVTADTIYYVINTATDTFQVSTTSGGAAVAITAKGSGRVQRVVPKIVANTGDTLSFNAAQVAVAIY